MTSASRRTRTIEGRLVAVNWRERVNWDSGVTDTPPDPEVDIAEGIGGVRGHPPGLTVRAGAT